MYWPLLNMYLENFRFGPGGFFISRVTFISRKKGLLWASWFLRECSSHAVSSCQTMASWEWWPVVPKARRRHMSCSQYHGYLKDQMIHKIGGHIPDPTKIPIWYMDHKSLQCHVLLKVV